MPHPPKTERQATRSLAAGPRPVEFYHLVVSTDNLGGAACKSSSLWASSTAFGDPLAEGDYFPGDLLLNVLRIDPSFWTTYPTLAEQLDRALDAIPLSARLDAERSERISAFRAWGV